MTAEPPLRVRSLIALDRAVEKTAWLLRTTLGRIVCLAARPAERNTVTAWVYGEERIYRHGSGLVDQGLFSWEVEAVRTPPFPSNGRLLVGGVGGGREMVGLARLGYEVVAFEPSGLVEGATAVARDLPDAEVVRASYADVVAAAQGQPGPMTGLLARDFAGVVLGWGSLSHLVSADERRGLLVALRRLLPWAPVVCSFWSEPEVDRRRGVERAVRRISRWTDRFQEPGLRFLPHTGFIHLFTRAELEELAAGSGYRIAMYWSGPFAHALLAPVTDDAPWRDG